MALEELLEAARNVLDITWEDAEGDRKLTGMLLRGMAYLDRIAGTAQDYEAEGAARSLLLDYVRYVRSGALDEFAGNYQHELLALQLDNWKEKDDATNQTTGL